MFFVLCLTHWHHAKRRRLLGHLSTEILVWRELVVVLPWAATFATARTSCAFSLLTASRRGFVVIDRWRFGRRHSCCCCCGRLGCRRDCSRLDCRLSSRVCCCSTGTFVALLKVHFGLDVIIGNGTRVVELCCARTAGRRRDRLFRRRRCLSTQQLLAVIC